jgi:hypothetical protein
MKKKPIIFISVMIFVLVIWEVGFTVELPQDKLRSVMERYDFDNWNSGTGKVLSAVEFSEKIYRGLSGMQTDIPWKKSTHSVGKIDGIPYSVIRQSWRTTDESGILDITMVVCPNFDTAKNFLIRRYSISQAAGILAKSNGRNIGLELGNVCFGSVTPKDNHFSTVDFIRENIVVMTRAEGKFKTELEKIVRDLDERLESNEVAKELPMLMNTTTNNFFYAERTAVSLGDSIPLHLQKNPQDSGKLKYFWKLTGGGIEKDRQGNFYYYAGEEGKHTITLTILDNYGNQSTNTIDILVGR